MQTAKNVNGATEMAPQEPAKDRSVTENKCEDSTPITFALKNLQQRSLKTQLAKRLLDVFESFDLSPQSYEAGTTPAELPQAVVQDALAARASDIHIEPGTNDIRVRFRIDGALSDVASLSMEQGKWLTNQFKALASLDPVVRFTPKDSHAHLSFNGAEIDLRLALAPCQRGEALSIRLLDAERLERSLADLGLTKANLRQVESWLEDVNGMFLSAGPTGCGKTTTIYALLHELKYRDRAIVSIEDPVEYEIAGINQLQLDEKHHLTFAQGVKAMLRLDPDFLMIGEIRDAASAHAAVDAAITGRVLLSTVHARDAVGVMTALRNWGLTDHEIAESLSVVVAQRLVRRLCPKCLKPDSPSESDLAWLNEFCLPIPKHTWSAAGCDKCNGLGYLGRTGIFELWRLGEMDYRLLLKHADEHRLRHYFHETQKGNLLTDGFEKVTAGITTLEELRTASSAAFPCGSV